MIVKSISNSFQEKIYLIYDCTEEQAIKYVGRLEGGNAGEAWQCRGKTFIRNNIHFWIETGSMFSEIAILYHEVGHVLFETFRRHTNTINYKTSFEEETFLYAQEDMVKKALNFIEAHKKSKKKKKDGNKAMATSKGVPKK